MTKANVVEMKAMRKKLKKSIPDNTAIKATSKGLSKLSDDPLSVLKKKYRMTLKLIPIAEVAYRTKPIQFNATSLRILMEQSNELMQLIKNIEEGDVANRVISNILDPMIEALIKQLSNDLLELQRELMKVAPEHNHNQIKRMIREVMENFGSRGREIYEQVKKDVRDEL